MSIGTAGFTAMLALMTLEQYGLRPEAGPAVVTIAGTQLTNNGELLSMIGPSFGAMGLIAFLSAWIVANNFLSLPWYGVNLA